MRFMHAITLMVVLLPLSLQLGDVHPALAARSQPALFSIKVNFQPSGATPPAGYQADTGAVYGARGGGYSYGWNADNSANTRERNAIADQTFDTLVRTQNGGNFSWEIAVPDGRYTVLLAAGDPSYIDSYYHVLAEGSAIVNRAPTTNRLWGIGQQVVTVSDGRLSLTNGPRASNNKLAWVEIRQHLSVKVNFQPADAAVPAGYLADSGAVYGERGNGYSYGWNADNSANTRDRDATNSPDQRYDTLVRTQNGGDFSWSIGLPNGGYDVLLVAGDPSYTDSIYHIDVNSRPLVRATPRAGALWAEGSAGIGVTDGRLRLTNAAGAINNKLAFIEITAQNAPPNQPAPFFDAGFDGPNGPDLGPQWTHSGWEVRGGTAYNDQRGYASLLTSQPYTATSYVLETYALGFGPLQGPSPADSTDFVFGGTSAEDWNFYRVIYYPTPFGSADRLLLQRVGSPPGQEIQTVTLDSASLQLPTDRYLHWKIVRNGTSGLIQVYIESESFYQPIPVLEATDLTYPALGHFGWILESQSVGPFNVDWVRARPLVTLPEARG